MPKTTDSVIFSDIERTILETALQNPDLSNAEIAEETGARITLVRDTRANYEDEVELAEDVADETGDSAETPAAVDDADLSEAQAEILEAVASDPSLSNAEVAAETGARITLVRDTRSEYGDAIDASADADDESTDDESDSSAAAASAEPTDTQAAILELAEQNPELTNAEIAEAVGARITLVRDTRSEFDGDDVGTDSAAGASTEIDTSEFSETQIEILETAQANPELTNAEIAEETDSRITLVRDTISQHEADDAAADEAAVEESTASDDKTDVLADVDTDAFSGAQLEILETALANPELTNGEIAERTDSRIALVRDTLYEHEYDDKPWDKDLDDDASEDDTNEDDEATTPSEEPIEMPETTDSDLLSAAEREILEAALENSELTNAEIAEETGSRLTLVRDTRATYEEAVDLPEDASEADETASAGTDTTGEPTARQREILEAISANPEGTNAEIAEETGARITFVRDTRAAYDADEVTDSVDSTTADDTDEVTDSVDSTTADDTDEVTESGATAAAEPSSDNTRTIIAILIILLLLIGLAVVLSQ